MKIKFIILLGFATVSILVSSFNTIAFASPTTHCEEQHPNPEKIQAYIESRLDQLAKHLEISTSQQFVWLEFKKSIIAITDQDMPKPNLDADAASIARFRAERATEFANRLTVIADSTLKLQGILTADQQITFNNISQHLLSHDHQWKRMSHMHHHKQETEHQGKME